MLKFSRVCMAGIIAAGITFFGFQTNITAAAKPTYVEGFEGAVMGGWRQTSDNPGKLSSAQKFHGSQSYEVNVDNNYNVLIKEYAEPQNGIVRMWFYDDAGKKKSYSFGGRVDANAQGAYSVIGVEVAKNPDVYTVLAGAKWEETNVSRSTGWHELVWDYSSGSHLDMYLDGKKIKSTTEFKAFTQVSFGSFWPKETNKDVVYFDHVEVYDKSVKVTDVIGSAPVESKAADTPSQGASGSGNAGSSGAADNSGLKSEPRKVEINPEGVAIASYYVDFEDALPGIGAQAGWESSNPSVGGGSEDLQYSGKMSFAIKVNQDYNALVRRYEAPQQGIVRVWFYDDDHLVEEYSAGVRVDSNSKQVFSVMGVEAALSRDRYTVLAGGKWEVSDIPRTTGWHEFVWDYSSGAKVDMYIDGRLVKSSKDFINFIQIAFGNFWPKANGNSMMYVDDIAYFSASTPIEEVLGNPLTTTQARLDAETQPKEEVGDEQQQADPEEEDLGEVDDQEVAQEEVASADSEDSGMGTIWYVIYVLFAVALLATIYLFIRKGKSAKSD